MTSRKGTGLAACCACWILAWNAAVGAGPGYTIESEIVWRTALDYAGTVSPRALDVNADGFDDVVLGSGLEGQWGAVVVLDGKTGAVLWSRRTEDEVLVAAPLLDIDGDRVPEVFVAGRKRLADVLALSGKDGKTVWRLTRANPQATFPPVNFINLLPVDDRNGDGQPDLLVVQSGGDDTRRLAARFHLIGSVDGSLLATHIAPDGKESYAMPLYQGRAGGDAVRFYIGTGGETLSGNLFRLAFPEFEEQWRIRSTGGGFIASPVLVDLEGDGKDELIAAGMNGAAYRIDADSGAVAWRWRERPYWAYATPAAGAFGGDATLDVVVGFNRGKWPRRDASRVVWLDGATGKVLSEREFVGQDRFTASSPLVLDVNHDGLDETLIVLSNPVPATARRDESSRLLLIDGGAERLIVFDLELEGYSIATPRLADLDGDGKLDLIHVNQNEVLRIEWTIEGVSRIPSVRWSEMRGPDGAGVYPPSR